MCRLYPGPLPSAFPAATPGSPGVFGIVHFASGRSSVARRSEGASREALPELHRAASAMRPPAMLPGLRPPLRQGHPTCERARQGPAAPTHAAGPPRWTARSVLVTHLLKECLHLADIGRRLVHH